MLFIPGECVCVCVRGRRTEAIFQLKRQRVYVVAGVSERKRRKDSGKHTNGRDSSPLLQNNPRFPEVRIHSQALAFFTTSSKVKQAVLVPPPHPPHSSDGLGVALPEGMRVSMDADGQ